MLAHNHKARVLANTPGQLDSMGVSRKIHRLFGSPGSRGHEDAFATIKEPAMTDEGWGDRTSSGNHQHGRQQVDGGSR